MKNTFATAIIFTVWVNFSGLYAQEQLGSKPEKVSIETLTARMSVPSDTLVLYNFWATWCRPCVAELPHFQAIDSAFHDQKVKVVFVSIDFPDQEKNLSKFIAQRKFTQPMWWLLAGDPNDWIPQIHTEWSGTIPTTVAVMPGTSEKKLFEQEFTREGLTNLVTQLLTTTSKP